MTSRAHRLTDAFPFDVPACAFLHFVWVSLATGGAINVRSGTDITFNHVHFGSNSAVLQVRGVGAIHTGIMLWRLCVVAWL